MARTTITPEPASPTPLPSTHPPQIAREHLQPTYSEAFRCIASACEDTCCRGWSVPVDQASYEKYRSDPALKPFVGNLIVLNAVTPSTSDYARMPLTMTGNCGFLDEQHLCGIQKHLGEAMLPVTCATYPRAIQSPSGEPEIALNLSCPEAARLVLLNPALLNSVPWPLRLPRAYATIWQDDGAHLRPGEIRLLVRDFVLTLLGDRRYPLWQRLYLLGPVVRRLKALAGGQALAGWCEANPAVTAHILADSARTAAGLRLRPVMADLAAQPADQLQIVSEILRMRLAEPPTSQRFIECIQDFELGLQTNTARNEQEVLDAYANGLVFFNALVEQQPQLIENYLLNHVFKNSFPFGRQPLRFTAVPSAPPDPESEHTLLCVLATLAQTMLVGIAAHYREDFGLHHVVKLIQSLARAIEHGTTFPARLAEYVQQRGPDAILIRSAILPAPPANPSPSPAHPRPAPAYLPQTFPSPSLPAHPAP
jgi:lysine-N-methylase